MCKPTYLPGIFLFLSIFGFQHSALSQQISRLDGSKISHSKLDSDIEAICQKGNVQGMGICIFNNNEVAYLKTFGYKRLDSKQKLMPITNMYGASLSKAVFAVLVMKLVEEQKLDLDKPLQSYLPKPIFDYPSTKKWHDNYQDLKKDTLYGKITARMCLDHTTGMPNWRWYEPDQKLRVKFKPGSRYLYSGEGLVYLQVVLEHMLGRDLESVMQEKVLKPAGMARSSFKWQNEFENDFAFGHKPDGTLYEKDKDNEVRSASTLETTVLDFSQFCAALLQNKLLEPASRKALFTKQIQLRSVQQFGPLSEKDTNANDAISLGYGLGWGLLKSPYGAGAFKEGHGDGFQHYCILFPEAGKGVIIMSNSDNAESTFKALLELTIRDVYTPWYWQNYIPNK